MKMNLFHITLQAAHIVILFYCQNYSCTNGVAALNLHKMTGEDNSSDGEVPNVTLKKVLYKSTW